MRKDLRSWIRTIPDYPKEGILFRDISPILASPSIFRAVIAEFGKEWSGRVDGIVALDARGFIFGSPLAIYLHVPLVMVRKRGKLPGDVITTSYELEYGANEMEIQRDACPQKSHILIVDDLLATGGSAIAARTLIEKLGAVVAGYAFVIELTKLRGRHLLGDIPTQSLVTYDD